jgi:hypothetical protein
MWFDRKVISQQLQRIQATTAGQPSFLPSTEGDEGLSPISRLSHLKVVDFAQLRYDQDLGLYCYEEMPFTGVCTQRYPDGELKDFVQNVQGLAHGISVAWYSSGQISLYNEMAEGVCHGLSIEWAEDGSRVTEQLFNKGRLIRGGGKKPQGGKREERSRTEGARTKRRSKDTKNGGTKRKPS